MGSRVRTVGGRLLAVVGALAGLVVLFFAIVMVKRVLPDDTSGGGLTAPGVSVVDSTATRPASTFVVPDSLRGRSRALNFAALTAAEADGLPELLAAFGDTVIHSPGTFTAPNVSPAFHFFILRPFGQKRGEMLGQYRLGMWPAERWIMAENYLNPDGFIEVLPVNADLQLSTHFRIRDFFTNDQLSTWPKYILLEERLIDKLELVLGELNARGINSSRAVVLSGFRAPYYNDRRIDEGAARASRHQFGDAADLIIDADADGRMDDLNRDGRRDMRDLNAIGTAVAVVERQFPELVGGLGTYAAMGPSGPFAHIDVRGTSARWERARAARPNETQKRNR